MTAPLTAAGFGVPGRVREIEARLGASRARPVTPRPSASRRPLTTGSPAPATGLATQFDALVAAAPVQQPSPASARPAGPTRSVPVRAGDAVIEAARAHLGVSYQWGGTDPATGFDCSGLVQAAYRAIGVALPKWSRQQATMGIPVASLDEALPGDLLTFGQPVNHVALYAGDGRMLHAPRTGEVVKVEAIDRPIASIRRIVTPGPATPSPAASASTAAAPSPAAGARGAAAYRQLFETAGLRWNIDPVLLAAVAQTESGFNPRAVSPAGAEGLMQFMPATAASMGVDPWDPASAIDGAARYLRTSLDQFGSAELAIASYNAGRGAVTRHGGVPPYPETRSYVRSVLDAWRARP